MRVRSGRFISAVGLGLATLLTIAGLVPGVADTPATAVTQLDAVKSANLANFKPGEIVSDAVFFNSSTMTEQQIQAFLEAKVSSCQSGYTCLKDWYDTSRATAADAMCGAYSGGWRERASTIIYKVAQACGINPQVILVTLQKEQGLVTHTWPSEWRYTSAMGQGCPDTAACDVRYYGFFNQVYGAAWQLKRYANPPGTSQYFTWYAPGKTWSILYNPNRDCGSAPVYIENQATANLYYYTPYQPNRAALNAGYGEGDGCSSYGNRNFYNYFTDWFGSTIGFAVSGSIAVAWSEQGGASGWLGQPTAAMVYSSAAGGGWYQYFQNGVIYVVQGGPTTILRTGSALTQLYMSTGGPTGWLGWPTAAEVCGAGGCAISFQNGTSAWSNRTGAINQMNGGLNTIWIQGGGVDNPIGVPAGSMKSVGGAAPGWYQPFDNAYVFLPAGKDSVTLPSSSGITQRYVALGAGASALGWPVGTETCKGSSCAVAFEHATSVWSAGVGIVEIPTAIVAAWQDAYGLGSWLGGPVAEAKAVTANGGGWTQRFQNGVLYLKTGGEAVALRSNSGITQRYESAGGAEGSYGWPRSEERCGASACATDLGSGTIAWDAGAGIHDVSGLLRDEYQSRGGVTGGWGAPLTDTLQVGSAGVRQDFRGGWVYLKNGGKPVTLRTDSGLAAQYRSSYQGPAGQLGWPTAEEVCDDAECRIVFEGGTLAWSRTTGAITRR